MYSAPYIVLFLGISAITCSFLSSFWCRSIYFEPATTLAPQLSFGIWFQKETEFFVVSGSNGETTLVEKNSCVSYSDLVPIDTKWKTARAFSIIAPVVGIFAIGSIFCIRSDKAWKITGLILLLFVTLFQGLTFVLLQSNACQGIPLLDEVQDNIIWYALVKLAYPNNCLLGAGSTVNIIATVLWFISGLIMLIVGPPDDGSK